MALPPSSVGRNSFPNLRDKETLWQQTYREAFRNNYDSVQRWTRWKDDHEQVKSALTTLPEKLCHEVVIPFGSKALMKAKLVHTNEVLTCIGGSWFVKQSAKQGIAMCERRINHSEEMLSQLEGERTLLTNRQTLPKLEEAFPNNDSQEIVEEYNEEAEAEWRRQHREREAEYHRKLADLRKRQVEHPVVQTEEDLFRRLDELELEEELNDELERLHAEYEADYENNDEDEGETSEEDKDDDDIDTRGGNNDRTDDRCTDSPESQTSLLNMNSTIHNIKSKCEEIDSSVLKEKISDNLSASRDNTIPALDAWGEKSTVHCKKIKNTRRISFADETQSLLQSSKGALEEDENIYIRFHHSKEQPKESFFKTSAALLAKDAPVFNTPADIFDNHKAQLTSTQPKSILKKSSSYPDKFQESDQQKPFKTSASFGSSLGIKFSDSEDDNDNPTPRDLSHLPPVLCEVQESTASVMQPSNQETSCRPVSRFKLARQSGKKH